MARLFLLITPFVAAACLHCGPPGPLRADTPDECAAACDHLRALQCPEGEPAPGPDGEEASCEDVCNNTSDFGISLDTACVRKISACSEINSCTEAAP